MADLIDRQAAIDAVRNYLLECQIEDGDYHADGIMYELDCLPSVQPEQKNERIFQEIVVEYPSISTYPECEGKPYFSIKYTEDRQDFIGYGTYKPDVLSEYLKKDFMPSAQPEIVRCKDCKHFYLDKPYVIQGVPVLGHEVCDAWGDGCKTSQDGYCFLAERRTDE